MEVSSASASPSPPPVIAQVSTVVAGSVHTSNPVAASVPHIPAKVCFFVMHIPLVTHCACVAGV
jgi:hypothetical protein